MSAWDIYPTDYRQNEVHAILSAVQAGECAAVIGLSGAGKSNLMGFLANRCQTTSGPHLMLVDGNRAAPRTASGLLRLALRALGESAPTQAGDELAALDEALARRLAGAEPGLALLIDRFDALPPEEQINAGGALRALRDAYKYRLTYVIAARRPVDPVSELAELFYANTLWLGPLSPSDARWSARQYAERQKAAGRDPGWDENRLDELVRVSWGYPALLRASCEALALGCPLEPGALRAHPAIQRRVQEFWDDQPSAEAVERAGLTGQPLLGPPPRQHGNAPVTPDDPDLTASEERLLACLQALPGQVVPKDTLISAVWPEERVSEGLRDDSLAQLIRRLRQKVEPDPAHPRHILTAPGRGYRYVP